MIERPVCTHCEKPIMGPEAVFAPDDTGFCHPECLMAAKIEHGRKRRVLGDSALDLLQACERSLALLLHRLDLAEILDEEKRHIDVLRIAIRRAKGCK